MPDIELWKVFVSLGVPGLALGILYMLFKNFKWQFPSVPRAWVGPIIILFLLILAFVVLYTLTLWAPSKKLTIGSQEKGATGIREKSRSNAEDGTHSLEPFAPGIFGIIVAPFGGDIDVSTAKGREIQGTIMRTLNARFRELSIANAEAREIKTPNDQLINTHKKAREIGKHYNGELVLWGHITLAGVIPHLTIVNVESEASLIINPNTVILKNSLTHTSISKLKDIRFPAITDEPTCLVSFVIGLRNYQLSTCLEEQLCDLSESSKIRAEAIRCFDNSFPSKETEYIDLSAIYYYRGICYYKSGRCDDAISDLSRVVESGEYLSIALNARGLAHAEISEYQLAINDYDEAIRIDPYNDAAYTNRGAVYYAMDLIDQAVMDHSKAIEIDNKSPTPYYNRAKCYAKIKDYQNAIKDYNYLLSIKPVRSCLYCTYIYRGLLYRNIGDVNLALQDFDSAISLNQQYPRAYMERAILFHYYTHELDKAVSEYDLVLRFYSNQVIEDIYQLKALILREFAYYDNRVVSIEELGLLSPQNTKESVLAEVSDCPSGPKKSTIIYMDIPVKSATRSG